MGVRPGEKTSFGSVFLPVLTAVQKPAGRFNSTRKRL